MIILLYVLLLVLCLWGVEINFTGFYAPFDRRTTDATKGAFIALVFIRHIFEYIVAGGWRCEVLSDRLFLLLNRCVGQLLVVMFLFYSGYGVMYSLLTKGREYLMAMPRRRILTTLLNFDVAVLIFAVANLLLGLKFGLDTLYLSLVGWESIGNSNWYIFDILVCYALFWCVFLCVIGRNSKLNRRAMWLGVTSLFLVVFSVGVVLFHTRPEWWSNTIMAFPFGCLWAVLHVRIEEVVKRHYRTFLFCLLSATLLLIVVSLRVPLGIWYNIVALVFASTVIVVSMKIRMGNAALVWCGVNLFPLYIYQRIPMCVFSRYFNGVTAGIGMWAYIVICLSITCAIAHIYRRFEIKLK